MRISEPYSSANSVGKTILIHLGFWSLFVAAEYVANMFHYSHVPASHLWRDVLISLGMVMIPTYFVAGILIPKYLAAGKIIHFSVGVLIAVAFVFFTRLKMLELIIYFETDEYPRIPATKVLKNSIRDCAMIALASCISIIRDWRAKRRLSDELAELKGQAEIKLLKSQLHPHFLFNTLNNIYSLALKKSDLTAESIMRLTNLLDYLVYWSDKAEVAMCKEVELIENYCEMEKLRHGDRLELNIDMDKLPVNLMASPLIFLPFVENSFKHGGEIDGKYWVNIKLKQYENKVVFNIENSVGTSRSFLDEQSHGVGLENIKKRLAILYPNRYTLDIDSTFESYSVRLEIDMNA